MRIRTDMKAGRTPPANIDDYIKGFPPPIQAILRQVRRAVRKAAPHAQEVISYAMPALRQHGILVYFAAFRNHIGLYPPVRGDARILKAVAAYAGEKGNLRFPYDKPIPYDLISRIVALRVRQDAAKAAGKRNAKKQMNSHVNSTPQAQLGSFIARFGSKEQKLIRSIRTGLRKRFATANELVYDYGFSLVVGYSPTDRGIDSIVSFSARTTGVALYFNRGPELPDPKRLLLGSGRQTRFLELKAASRLSHPDVKRLMSAAIGLSKIPLPSAGKGTLIIKSDGTKKRSPRAKKSVDKSRVKKPVRRT